MGWKNRFEKQACDTKMLKKSLSQKQLDEKINEFVHGLYGKQDGAFGHVLIDWFEAERIVKKELDCCCKV